jgi:hypothetical protein
MRERTPLPREVLQHLPRLKLIASTGSRNPSIDMGAAKELGIAVTATGYRSSPTIEMTWALILASLRGIVHENNSIRNGGWQKSVGQDLSGKTLGVVGGLAMSAGRSRELVLNSYGGEVETFAQHIIKANTIDTLKFLNDESFELRDRFTMDALTLLRDVSDAYRALQSAWSLLPLVGPLPVMKMPGAAASAQHAHTCPGEGYSRNVIYRTRIEQILPAH